MTRRLPDGFTVRLSDTTRVCDGGRTLVGGAPTRAMFLNGNAAAALLHGPLKVADDATATFAAQLLDAGIADPEVEALPDGDLQEVTFVIPTRDRVDSLGRLLAGIVGAGVTGSRIVVVDDASRDRKGVAEVAAQYGVQLIPLAHNVGPADARNAGLVQVSTRFVMFVDSDVVLERDAAMIMLRHFADPSVALVAPRVRAHAAGSRRTWVERYEDARSSLDLGSRPALVKPRAPVSWVSSTCLLARVEALGEGFGRGMRVAEDVDLVWRLVDQGWSVRYEPRAVILHEHRSRLRPWLLRKAFYGTGADALAKRHPFAVAPAVLAPWSVAFLSALLLQRRWSLPLAAVVFASTTFGLSRRLPRAGSPLRLAVRLTFSGASAAIVQTMALLLRHWWPAAFLAAVVSRRGRRAVMVAAVLDSVIEYVRLRPALDPVRFSVLRRLDDLAYGAGVWWGAIRGRSPKALLPDFRRRR